MGDNHGCLLRRDGKVFCWGANGGGQLGDGTSTSRPVMENGAEVSVVAQAIAVSAGGNHTCALKADGRVYCWGNHTYGQLGPNGTSGSVFYRAAVVTSGTATNDEIAGVGAGGNRTCVVLRDGTARCWGNNSSLALGNHSETNASTSTVTGVELQTGTPSNYIYSALSPVAAIATDCYFGCALRPDGKVFCWGANGDGQLGRGTTTSSETGARAVSGI